MSGLFGPDGDGTTELPEELRDQLVPTWIATTGEVYQVEEDNIATATLGLHPHLDDLLDDIYLRRLHKAMLRDVWRWAGRYRRHDTNIGVVWTEVPGAVRSLLDDVRAWIASDTRPADEISLRFHHHLERIHPFPNGNGRFGRITADHLAIALGGTQFSWGAADGLDTASLRARYLSALRRMDRDDGDIDDLLVFARS
ncbi:MAG: mobile mystery protein B [Acidimicrobiia bacterium]|nr:mobile mystery protein B [Acidimicrobiia bacterium]